MELGIIARQPFNHRPQYIQLHPRPNHYRNGKACKWRRHKRAEAHKKAAADAIEDLSTEEAIVLGLTEEAFKKLTRKIR